MKLPSATLRPTKCDLCDNVHFAPKGTNSRKNGHPTYLFCRFCYLFSVPHKLKSQAKMLNGKMYREATSGKTFSSTWKGTFGSARRNRIAHNPLRNFVIVTCL
jgi:hypothetical protein